MNKATNSFGGNGSIIVQEQNVLKRVFVLGVGDPGIAAGTGAQVAFIAQQVDVREVLRDCLGGAVNHSFKQRKNRYTRMKNALGGFGRTVPTRCPIRTAPIP